MIRFGILSTARITVTEINAINNSPNAKLVALSSRNISRIKNFVNNHKPLIDLQNIKIYGSYDELIHDKNIDVIYIPLPTSLRLQWVIKSANMKKHIIIEKPLKNENDIQNMIDICKKNNVHLMDNTMFVHSERTKEIYQKYIEKRRPMRINVVMNHFYKDFSDIRYQKELEPMGALGDLGWYAVRSILWCFKYEELPGKVFATIDYLKEVPVNVTCMLWFKNEIASFSCSFLESSFQNLMIFYDDLVITVPNFCSGDSKYYVCEKNDYKNQKKIKVENPDQVTLLINHFTDEIISKKYKNWSRESLLTMKVLDAIILSSKEGRIVAMNM